MKFPLRTNHLPADTRVLRPGAPVLRCLLLLLPVLLLSSAFARPAAAQERPVLAVFITSDHSRLDGIAVSYTGDVSPEEMQRDLVNLAQELHAQPPKHPKITRGEVFKGQETISTAEAKFPGLVNWSTGTVNLDAVIQTYRRFGFFRVVWLISGTFPIPPSGSVTHPGYRVETLSNGFVVDQRVWIDQSRGAPGRLEPVTAAPRPAWVSLVALAAILLILAVSLYLIVHVSRGQRRASAARGGK